jgi:hypothetical protein
LKKQSSWAENLCWKWKGWNLEEQSTHQNSKHTFVNNWLFRIKWGFRFRANGNPKWMNKKSMKKLDEKSWMNNWPGIFWFYTPFYK